ncbi:hypothetical protein D3C87_129680 [compost metagenome]
MTQNNFNSYNARHIKAEDIAKSFVISNSFLKILENSNSIVLGARGCGKTTMMKMLTLPALHSWGHKDAQKIRENLSFYSIYVSTDIYWDLKNQSFADQLSHIENLQNVISRFSVNSSIFLAACETFKNIITYELCDSDSNLEIQLCDFLINSWKLPKNTIPQLASVTDAINERIDYVNQQIQKLVFNKSTNFEFPDYFFFDFASSLIKVISKFEDIFSQKKKSWALCFDELEFAPQWLQEQLYSSLRSRDQRILYKLSSSPILPSILEKRFTNESAPSVGNDFTLIKMWDQADEPDFIKNLINSYVIRNSPDVNYKNLFGSNEIYSKEGDSYIQGSEFHKEIKELHKKDISFKEFLISKGINIEAIDFSKENNDTVYRKIKPIVYYRNYFIMENDSRAVRFRTRKKASDLYYGIEVLTKICDGNPRWLISLLNDLFIYISKNGDLNKVKQTDEILRYSKRFLNVISNIPLDSNSSYTFKNFINKIGGYFKEEILGPIFKMDPLTTFIVDEDTEQDILILLEKGVAQGAFIIVNSNDEDLDFDLKGKRLKLSYLLYPIYYLPLRKYEGVQLKDCLHKKHKPNKPKDSQMKLF